jgi:hypothetical protein
LCREEPPKGGYGAFGLLTTAGRTSVYQSSGEPDILSPGMRGSEAEWWLIYAVGGAVLLVAAIVAGAYFLAVALPGLVVVSAGMALHRRRQRR